MAESVGEPVAESAPQSGGGLKGAIKRIKPGEWALIGLGVASLVLFYIWYQNQQNNNASSATTTPDPNWQNANAQPGGIYDSELAALLSQIASGQFTTPGTTVTTLGGGSGGTPAGGGTSGGTAGSTGSIAGGAKGTASSPGVVSTGLVSAEASSASGLTHVNQSPVRSAASVVHETGKVGTTIPGTKEKAPPNVSSSIPKSTQSGGQTLGSEPRKPTKPPANVTRSLPSEFYAHPVTTKEPPKPKPKPAPKRHPVPPVKPPANVRPR